MPTQAPMPEGGTATPRRPSSYAAAAARNAGLPTEVGYDRSAPEEDSAATTAGNGGSVGSPIERSTMPPGSAAALSRSGVSRS